MFTTIVHVYVKRDSVEAFIAASEKNHKASIEEPENRRFDLLQDAMEPTKFILYEAYVSKEGAVAHKQTEHYQQWRDRVAGMMEKPREGVVHHGLFTAQ